MYTVKARYYSESDNFGETFVLKSDNWDKDLNIEVGRKVRIIPPQEHLDPFEDVEGQLLFDFMHHQD